eukprot:3449838-Alexandrium_andersonii.AAC.1
MSCMPSLTDKRKKGKFSAKARPGIFLGLVLQRGHGWKQDCWMIGLGDLAQFRPGQIKTAHIHQAAEVFDDREHPGIVSPA